MSATPVSLRRELISISRRSDNTLCCDCLFPQPTWASINLGIFICMNCAGMHRNLGTHISKVRSLDLDNWDNNMVQYMGTMGNIKANSYWEAKLPSNNKSKFISPTCSDAARNEFI